MSWSYTGIGRAAAVATQMETQLSAHKCTEPEETIKGQAVAIVKTALGAYPDDVAAKVAAYGSQWTAKDGRAVNSLKIEIESVQGLVS